MTQKLLTLMLLAALALAGCLGGTDTDDRDDDGENNVAPAGPDPVPEPVTITGSAAAANPLHSFICVRSGVDGELHSVPAGVENWRYAIEPAGSFVAYWFGNDGLLDGGAESGTVPSGATEVEVCKESPTGPLEYALVFTHPDHEGTAQEEEGDE